MQLPQIDRNAIRPAGSEVVAPAANRVIPVAPVNPPTAAPESASVVNEINPAVQAHANAQAVDVRQAPQADPLQSSGSADASHKDWTQRKEATVAQKAEVPPKEPMSKMLMEHMHAVWSASARVVEIWMQNNPNPNSVQQLQAQNQATNRQVDPLAAPGVMAKEVLTYSPSRVKKPERAE